MPQLPQCLRLDLPDAFTRDRERLANFFESVLAAVFETEAHLDDLFFAWRQGAKHVRSLVFQVDVDDCFCRRHNSAVFDEVAKMRIFFFANWSFERDRLLSDLKDLSDF